MHISICMPSMKKLYKLYEKAANKTVCLRNEENASEQHFTGKRIRIKRKNLRRKALKEGMIKTAISRLT